MDVEHESKKLMDTALEANRLTLDIQPPWSVTHAISNGVFVARFSGVECCSVKTH